MSVNIDSADSDGNTALIFSAKEGHVSIVEMLLKHSGNTGSYNCDGKTALDMAFEKDLGDIL